MHGPMNVKSNVGVFASWVLGYVSVHNVEFYKVCLYSGTDTRSRTVQVTRPPQRRFLRFRREPLASKVNMQRHVDHDRDHLFVCGLFNDGGIESWWGQNFSCPSRQTL